MPAKTKRDDGERLPFPRLMKRDDLPTITIVGLVRIPGTRHLYHCTVCYRRTGIKPSEVVRHTSCSRHRDFLKSRRRVEEWEKFRAEKKAFGPSLDERLMYKSLGVVPRQDEGGLSKSDPDLDSWQPTLSSSGTKKESDKSVVDGEESEGELTSRGRDEGRERSEKEMP